MAHNTTKMNALKNKIRRMKFLHGMLVGFLYLPFIFAISYFIISDWRMTLLLFYLLSVLFNTLLFRKIRYLAHYIDVYEITYIAYRVENGERFTPDHKDYQLYKRMVHILSGSHKKTE